jgi:diguanylate cyclase (GGDEF)-like protein
MQLRLDNIPQSKQDIATALIVFVIAYAVASFFDINEQWMEISEEYEAFELDEIPFGLAFLSMVFAWFTWRRWSEKEESEKQLRAQINLTSQREKRLAIVQTATITKSKQLTLLREMTEFLMLSDSSSECFSIFSNYLSKLLPTVSGSVFFEKSNNFTPQHFWGKEAIVNVPFSSKDCWAFRTGRTYDSHAGICSRSCSAGPTDQLCVPIKSADKLRGMVTIYCGSGLDEALADLYFENRDDLLNLLQPACDLLGIALSNIALRERLSDESNRDVLTGLLNRKGVIQAATRELQNSVSVNKPLSFMMFDIDHFKKVNDQYGHDIGDAVLVSLSSIISENIRAEDICCRYGGEEFLLIMPNSTIEQAFQKSEELRQIIQSTSIAVDNKVDIHITFSGGIACFPSDGDTLRELIKKADIALYESKKMGRNRIHFKKLALMKR